MEILNNMKYRTKEEIKTRIFNMDIIIPKHTRCTNRGAAGILALGHYFIDDLSWVPLITEINGKKLEKPIKHHMFLHDATYYGISLTDKEVENI